MISQSVQRRTWTTVLNVPSDILMMGSAVGDV